MSSYIKLISEIHIKRDRLFSYLIFEKLLLCLGETVLQMLENGVSKYPVLEGRFPQVAGIRFAFDPNESPGKRVDPLLVRIGDEYLVLDQYYKLSTKSYLHMGCDGYSMLPNAEVIVSVTMF